MAQHPDQSPRSGFHAASGSPTTLNGQPDSAHPPSTFGLRKMLPPSPQQYQPRYPPVPTQIPSPSLAQQTKTIPPLQTRPGSSMSISSMLGTDPDRQSRGHPHQPSFNGLKSYRSSQAAPPPSLAAMSPPQPVSRTGSHEYLHKPRSQTPDRDGISSAAGARVQRSGSGSMTQRSHHFDDANYRTTSQHHPFGLDDTQQSPTRSTFSVGGGYSSDQSRQTSIVGLRQRPSSQPQPDMAAPKPPQHHPAPPGPSNAWVERTYFERQPDFTPSNHELNDHKQRPSRAGDAAQKEISDSRVNAMSNVYDTRPPGMSNTAYSVDVNATNRGLREQQTLGAPVQHKPSPPSAYRHISEPTSQGAISKLLNEQEIIGTSSIVQETHRIFAQQMARQDSSQSQNERSILGDRLERGRARPFSPFASSVASQPISGTSALSEEQGRKGSDELSQHRALIGIAAEAKRGRFSPLPQAVQGAQAQSIGPETGIKSENGRVFSGIGSSVPPTNTGISSLSTTPFRRDDAHSRLSEENLMKVSRSTPGMSKRTRKLKDEDIGASSETREARSSSVAGRRLKRPRHQYFKLDGDDPSMSLLQSRATQLSSAGASGRISTPTVIASSPAHHHHPQVHHHHHAHVHRPVHHHHAPQQPEMSHFKPNAIFKIAPILEHANSNPRRHLGSYIYSPSIMARDPYELPRTKLNVSIRPNLLASFSDPNQVNCTYTVRVSRTWLRRDEREAICIERFLWGTAIFTDDSDPLAAAIHSGFVKGVWTEGVDVNILEQVIQQQNPQVDAGHENLPSRPVEPNTSKDLHITLLVLPQLQRYQRSVRNGVSSREWPLEEYDAPHDGVSFMVLNCEWVDEGTERGKARSGIARRRRLEQDFFDGPLKLAATLPTRTDRRFLTSNPVTAEA